MSKATIARYRKCIDLRKHFVYVSKFMHRHERVFAPLCNVFNVDISYLWFLRTSLLVQLVSK